MTRENLNSFENRNNVTKITSDNGSISYLTQSVSWGDETYAKGADIYNTVETEKKHVLFLFNKEKAEVGRYYLGQKLQGKTLDELDALKPVLCFFESWNPNGVTTMPDGTTKAGAWIPCIGMSQQQSLAETGRQC